MIRRGGGLRRAVSRGERAVRVGLTSFSSGGNLSIPAGARVGDLAIIQKFGTDSPTGGSGESWNSVATYSNLRLWYRVLRASDFVVPINCGASALAGYATFYRGAQSLSYRATGGGQGPPSNRLMPAIVKSNACRGFIAHNLGQYGETYGMPSGLSGFSGTMSWSNGQTIVQAYERLDHQNFLDNYQYPFTIATTDPGGQGIYLIELLAY